MHLILTIIPLVAAFVLHLPLYAKVCFNEHAGETDSDLEIGNFSAYTSALSFTE